MYRAARGIASKAYCIRRIPDLVPPERGRSPWVSHQTCLLNGVKGALQAAKPARQGGDVVGREKLPARRGFLRAEREAAQRLQKAGETVRHQRGVVSEAATQVPEERRQGSGVRRTQSGSVGAILVPE